LRTKFLFGAVVLVLASGVACRQDMHDQPKYIPLRPSEFFNDGRSERQFPDGTVARGHLNDDAAYYDGKGPDGKPLAQFPFPVTREVVQRGQDRYNVYCSPCHDRLGEGNGMVYMGMGAGILVVCFVIGLIIGKLGTAKR